jgi:hypothetical protein
MNGRKSAAAVALALAIGCGGGEAGHGVPTPPPQPGEVSPIPVNLSWISFEIRSALLAQDWPAAGLRGDYTLELHEEGGGCGALGTATMGPEPATLTASIPGLLDGTCQPGVPCEAAWVKLIPGAGTGLSTGGVPAEIGSLTLSAPFDGRELSGELRASFPRDPEWWSHLAIDADGNGYAVCHSTSGRIRVCEFEQERWDCCNRGKPLEEVVVPVQAVLCENGLRCGSERWCRGEAAFSCSPGTPPDCALACEHELAVCRALFGCEEAAWEGCAESRDEYCGAWSEGCPPACLASSSFPVFGQDYACLAASETVEAWTTCMASCGGDR